MSSHWCHIHRGDKAPSACHLQLLSGVSDVVSDTGTSSLWSLWIYWCTTSAPGVPIPGSSCCYERFGLAWQQGTWLLQSGSLDGVRVEVNIMNGWCELSFETPKYEPRYHFFQLVHSTGILRLPPLGLWTEWLDAGCLGDRGRFEKLLTLVLRLQKHHLHIWLPVWVGHCLFLGFMSPMPLCTS